MKTLFGLLSLIALIITLGCGRPSTEVMLVSTIHSAHEVNPNYTYEDLFAFIEQYNPDVIGVEIRAEDMDSSVNYLDRNYPYEMFTCIERYPNKTVVGIDWLGQDLVDRAIPVDYWRNKSELKQLQRQLSKDSIAQSKLTVADSLRRHKEAIAIKGSLHELNDGRYDSLNELYYTELEQVFESTPYQALTNFYAKRDSMIAANIAQTIRQHKGRRLLFLVGADHRSHALRTIKESFDEEILLNQPLTW